MCLIIRPLLICGLLATITARSHAFQSCPTAMDIELTPPSEVGWYARVVEFLGDWFIVGDTFDGTLRCYHWSGTEWVEVAGVVADGMTPGDGHTGYFVGQDDLLLGSAADREGAGGLSQVGAVDIALLSSGTPTLTSTVVPPTEIVSGRFGNSIAIDMPWVAIAQQNGSEGTFIHMYVTDGESLTLQQTLGWTFPVQGLSLSNNLLVASAPYADIDGLWGAGAIVTWTLSGGTWSHADTLTADVPAEDDHWGFIGRVDHDQLLLSVPGFYHGADDTETASVLRYTWNGTDWQYQQTLESPRSVSQSEVFFIKVQGSDVFIVWWEVLGDAHYQFNIDYWTLESGTLLWTDVIDVDGSTNRATRHNVAVKDGMVAFDGSLATDGEPRQQDRGVFTVPIVDCNDNGQADSCEILNGAPDDDADGLLDACVTCAADWNSDGRVDVADIVRLIVELWGSPDGDLTSDGATDVRDLIEMLRTWNDCP